MRRARFDYRLLRLDDLGTVGDYRLRLLRLLRGRVCFGRRQRRGQFQSRAVGETRQNSEGGGQLHKLFTFGGERPFYFKERGLALRPSLPTPWWRRGRPP